MRDGFLAAGELLRDRYEIVREIGRGGVSVVYEAIDRHLDSRVAVKLLVPPPAAAEVARERMRREVQTARQLRHPNIVRVYDVLEDGPWTFIIMELVEGGDLQSALRRNGPLSAETARCIGAEVAQALAFSHRRGVLHRDVKPQNLLLDDDGRPLLSDFGSARLDGDSTLTHDGGAVGTLAYMAPEVLAGNRADARADVYALGVTLYAALTGELPAGSSSHLPPTPAEDGYRPERADEPIPEALAQVVARATSAHPSARFATAESLAEALGFEGEASRPIAFSPPRRTHCLVCRGAEPLGFAVCLRCVADSPIAADTCLALVPPADAAAQQRAESIASRLAPNAAPAAVREAALGRKTLLQLSAERAEVARSELARQGVAARAIPVSGAWQLVPRSFKTLLLGVVVCGVLAGSIVGAWLAAMGFALASGLAVLAHRGVRTALVDSTVSSADAVKAAAFPAHVAPSIVASMENLIPGPARDLFADLVGLGRDCLAVLPKDTQGVLRDQVSNLLLTGCDAARELDGIDRALSHLDDQRKRFPTLPAGFNSALGRCELARDVLVQRLLECSAALGSTRSAHSTRPDGLSEYLAELARNVEDEVALQSEAAKEVAQLVA